MSTALTCSQLTESKFENDSTEHNHLRSDHTIDSISSNSSRSTISNPEDPTQRPLFLEPPNQCHESPSRKPVFELNSQTSIEEEEEGSTIMKHRYDRSRRDTDDHEGVATMKNRLRDRLSRDIDDRLSITEMDDHQLTNELDDRSHCSGRARSDSWSHRSRVPTAIAMRVANFKKSATQTNLLMNGSSDDLSQQRRFFNISNNSSLTASMDLTEQHPTPPAVEDLASSASAVSIAKHVHTEMILSKHSLKTQLTKCQRLLDAYLALLTMPATGTNEDEQTIIDELLSIATLMRNAWQTPQIGIDLAFGLCTYMRETGYLEILLDDYVLNPSRSLSVLTASVRALQPTLNAVNRVNLAGKLDQLVEVVKNRFIEAPGTSKEQSCEAVVAGVALFEQLFKSDHSVANRLIDMSALDYCLHACKTCRDVNAHRHCAVALANLCMNSDDKECQQKLMARNVPDWLYFLASSRDDATRYYACLAVCVLVSNKEIETTVLKSGTLSLVEPFLRGRNPIEFAFAADYRHQGRPKEWVVRLVAMLYSKRREPRMMAAFHLAMDASIKKTQERLDMLKELGAVEALRQAACMPDEAASEFARRALEIVGETAPYKLKPQVPLWTVDDVQYWVVQIGFETYADAFRNNMVDGDLLLLITEEELERDIGMKSGLFRKRFVRELESLKMVADYGCVDGTKLDRFLTSINPQFSIYTYQLLELGISDFRDITVLNDCILKNECRISNPVHRVKILGALDEFRQIDDMEMAVLKKQIDIFVSYRRSTGSQLASLLKVLLQLRGYKVFLDVDRLYAGQFDCSLFKNIQAADHFVLVLTPQSMDRCLDDYSCQDWVHKEIACALRFNKNVVPILDPQFEWPDQSRLPDSIKSIMHLSQVNWVHEYQDACVSKIEKFVKEHINVDRAAVPALCGFVDNRRDMG